MARVFFAGILFWQLRVVPRVASQYVQPVDAERRRPMFHFSSLAERVQNARFASGKGWTVVFFLVYRGARASRT